MASSTKQNNLLGAREPDSISSKDDKSKQVSARNRRPTLEVLAYVSARQADSLSLLCTEFHMTIRPKISELTPKQASMLAAIAVARAVHLGVDFTLYMSLEFLYNFLVKSGEDPLYIQNEKARKTMLLTELVLSSIRGTWYTLTEVEELPANVSAEIVSTGWLPSARTLDSWKQHWDLERYLQVRIVPVEQLINRNKLSTAERYTSYTRGYGQDGNATEPGKTKPSPELDGEDVPERQPEITLLEFETYTTILNQIIRQKQAKRFK